MTLSDIQTQRPARIPVADAAAIMGVPPRFLQCGLQQGRFPFGTAVKMERQWRYYINGRQFIAYMRGGREVIDCPGTTGS